MPDDAEVFEDLPPSGTGARLLSPRWDELLAECRRQAGFWVALEERPSAQLARGRAGFLRRRDNGAGRWEFSARTLDDPRRHVVLGRYRIDVEDAA